MQGAEARRETAAQTRRAARVCPCCEVDLSSTPKGQPWVKCGQCGQQWHVRCTGVLIHPDGDSKFSFTCVSCRDPAVPAATAMLRHRFSLSDPCTLIAERAHDASDWPMQWYCHVRLGDSNMSRVIFLTPQRVLMMGDPLGGNSMPGGASVGSAGQRRVRVAGLRLQPGGMLSVSFSQGVTEGSVSLQTKGQVAQRTRLVELATLAGLPAVGFAIAMTADELLEDEWTQRAMAVVCRELSLGLDTNVYRNNEQSLKRSAQSAEARRTQSLKNATVEYYSVDSPADLR